MSASPAGGTDAFLGRVENAQGGYVGTCFQISSGFLVTAAHVVQEALVEDDRANLVGRPVVVAPLTDRDPGTITARVLAVHETQDVAVLEADRPLAAVVTHLAYSDAQTPGTEFFITGCARLDDESQYKSLTTLGQWGRAAHTIQDLSVGAGTAPGAEPGMSGSPVLRTSDGAVIGVMSKRYNSEAWSRDRVWFVRVEDLVTILPPSVRVAVFETAEDRTDRSALLNVTYEDKARLTNEAGFFMPEEWAIAWRNSIEALESGKILLVVAPAGFGSTTFAEQLIAREGDSRLRVARLEPGDWDAPNAASLPKQPWHGYILDLQDPDHDKPSAQFLRGLNESAHTFSQAQSCLIVTIRDTLWSSKSAVSLENVRTVRIESPPDPLTLVERFFEEFDPIVIPAIRHDSVRTHLNGMNAIESSHAIGQIVDLLDQPGEGTPLSTQQMTEKIAEVLDSHIEYLDVLFGEEEALSSPWSPPSGLRQYRPLVLDDRCLLLTLSVRSEARVSELEDDWRDLLSELRGRADGGDRRLDSVLARAGIRGRLKRIRAVVDRNEVARFARPTFGGAVVRYVWDNYSEVRSPLVRWMCAHLAQESGQLSPASWVSGLVRRSQDVDFIRHELREIGDKEILKDVLFDACRDQHMRRRAERLLYDWAQSAEMQSVVVEVAKQLYLLDQRPIALRRLQRVADFGKISDVTTSSVEAAFEEILKDETARVSFLPAISGWLGSASAKTSAKLALHALIRDPAGIEVFIALERDGALELKPLLAELLIDESAHPIIVSMVKSATNEASYQALIDSLAGAARENGIIASLFRLSRALDAIELRSPVDDLSARLEESRSAEKVGGR
ncbi:trypsin-like peptidase domain-containing protein [Micromonospora sp. CA-240977]|uniref:trypsin-like peptidase domain-containing protein n=1 Tax=Micromonospora sp. CA-240977 TaxID=3239957 RepID=UPI003D8F6FD3